MAVVIFATVLVIHNLCREMLAFSRFHLLVYYSPPPTSPAFCKYLIFVYLYVLYTKKGFTKLHLDEILLCVAPKLPKVYQGNKIALLFRAYTFFKCIKPLRQMSFCSFEKNLYFISEMLQLYNNIFYITFKDFHVYDGKAVDFLI